MNGHVECLYYLLETGAVDVNRKTGDYSGYTALHMAVCSGRNPVVACRLLIEHGADLTAGDHAHMTALHLACSGGNVRLVELFLTEETVLVETRRRSTFGRCLPHHCAIEHLNNDVLAILFAFCDRNQIELTEEQQYRLATVAADRGNLEALRVAFDRYGDTIMDWDNDYCLSRAVYKRQSDCVRFLVERGLKPIPSLTDRDDAPHDVLSLASQNLTLAVLLPAITSEVVQEYNEQSEAGVIFGHPLFAALKHVFPFGIENARKNLITLLTLGVDPARPVVCEHQNVFEKRNRDKSFLCPSGIKLLQRLGAGSSNWYSYNIISCAIFWITENSKLKEIIELLLSHGASVKVASSIPGRDSELTALVALVMRNMSQWGKPLWNIFNRLLDEGADLNYRSTNSSFTSPDIAIASALQRNDIILAVVFGRTGLSTADLLADLKKVSYLPDENDETLPTKITKLRDHIGHVILTILRSSVERTPEIVSLCQELEDHFALVNPNIPRSSKCSPWSKIRSELGTGPLQNRCRRVIRQHFLEIGRYQQIDTNISKLPLPNELKKFLTF